LNFKNCCDFKTFPSEMLIFCVWQWVITLPIVKKFVVGHFYHLFGQNKGKQHFFGNKRAIVCMKFNMFNYSMQLNCTWKDMHSQDAGLFFQPPPPILHWKFYLD